MHKNKCDLGVCATLRRRFAQPGDAGERLGPEAEPHRDTDHRGAV